MNKYFFQIKNGSKNKGNKSLYRYNYLIKKDVHLRKIIHYISYNIPSWCNDDIKYFWESLDKYERSNARLFKEIKFHLPINLNTVDKIKILEDFCNIIFKQKFTYSYAIYDKFDSKGFLINSYSNIIFNQRVIDECFRDYATHFKRFNTKNPCKGGAKKDTETNSKNWLNNTRKELNIILNSYLSKNENYKKTFFEVDDKNKIIKIPQIHVNRKSFHEYQDNLILNHEIKQYLHIKNQNLILDNLNFKKNRVIKKISALKSKLKQVEMIEFLFSEKMPFDYDLIKNMGIIINDKGNLVFPLSLYNYNLNFSSSKVNEVIFYQQIEGRLLPDFNVEHIKNKNTLGIYSSTYGNTINPNEKNRVTITNNPIDIIYRASIDKLTIENYFNRKNIYIATFSNINNIEEVISYLSIKENFAKDILIAFDDERSSDFVSKLQLENKINGLFWIDQLPNKLGSWKNEFIFEMDKIHRIYSVEKINELNSINKNKIIRNFYPEYNEISKNIYDDNQGEMIQITNKNLAKFNKNNITFKQSIDFYMKISGVNYITACNNLCELLPLS